MQIHSSKLLLSDCSVIVKIIAYPANATVTINGIKTSELEIKKGEIVSWSVSFAGYYSQSGKFEAKKDVELTITLEKILYTFSITTSPTSAKVVMNGVETQSVTVEPGTNVAWEVSATGYYSQNGNQIVTENTSKKITLSSKTKVISVFLPQKLRMIMNEFMLALIWLMEIHIVFLIHLSKEEVKP